MWSNFFIKYKLGKPKCIFLPNEIYFSGYYILFRMFFKRLFVIFLLNSSNQFLYCQKGTVSGIVTANNKPIAGATLVFTNIHQSVIADSAGRFSRSVVPFGRQLIRVTAVGYIPRQFAIVQQEPYTFVPVVLQPDTTLIDEVVISGTLKPVSKLSSPILVEVYSPAYFKKNPAPNIFESLQMVNGIQPQLNCNVCNTGDIHINGMEGPYTMILIDGMPIVSSLSTVYGLAGIPNSMVKRIEIVKGPASTLYGSEAVGGLINIITKDAFSAEKLKVDFSATHIGEFNTDITTSKQFKNTSVLLGINYFNFQQKLDINSDNFTDLTLQKRLSVFNKWNSKLSHNRIASLALRYITESRWGGQLQWKPAFKGTDSVYGESISTNRIEVLGMLALSKNVSLDLSYNYHLQDSYYGTIKYYANQQVAFAQLRWSKQIGRHDMLAGVPFRYTFYDDNTLGTATIEGSNKPSTIFLPGIFVQDEFKVNRQFTFLTGLRYDYNNEHGNIFTPRFSCKYAPDNNNTFRLSFGNGYRVVNLFTEDHAALTGAREVVIAAALKPEQSWNSNINYSTVIRHSRGFIALDMSAFYTYFTNKIVGDFFSDPSKIIYDNLGGYAVSKGITVNTDINFTRGLKINAGITLMDVYQIDKDSIGKKIKTAQLFAPAISGTFSISYTIPNQRIAIDFTGRLNGEMYLPVVPNDFRSATSPFNSILNLQVTKTFNNVLEFYTGVKNLLNFLPKNPLLHPDDPFNKAGGKYFETDGKPRISTNPYNYTFDPSYNYAPMQGAKIYLGVRLQLK